MKTLKFLLILVVLTLITISCSSTDDSGSAEPAAPPEQAAETAVETTDIVVEEDTAVPEQSTNVTRSADGMEMVYIPAGEFMMGDDASAFQPEKPGHQVYLDEYWVDQNEVSNAQYRLCVEAGVCTTPTAWDNPGFNGERQPALVTWSGAQDYCGWANGRLPTEAEWEKAARGTDGRLWPWGNTFEDGRANLNGDADGYGFTAPVGMFPDGVSPYDVQDMAGNAAEWVADWYDADYYKVAAYENPTGPAGGEQKVIRSVPANGGGGPEKCRTVARYQSPPEHPRWVYGFRCVLTVLLEETAVTELEPATPPEPPAAEATDVEEEDGEETAVSNTGQFTEFGNLTSYRTHIVVREEESVDWIDITTETIFEPFAYHQILTRYNGEQQTGAMEMFIVEETIWTNMSVMGDNWTKTVIDEEEAADWQNILGAADEMGIEPFPYDESITYLPGQYPLPTYEGSLTPAGTEMVNGVQCQKYLLDSEHDYTVDLPAPLGTTHTTIQGDGEVWIAAQDGLPPVIIHAVVQVVEINELENGMITETIKQIEYDITDINPTLTIEAPE